MSVNALPTEILISIIDIATCSQHSPHQPDEPKDKPSRCYNALISVSRVCTLWRKTVLTCGMLWCEIFMRQDSATEPGRDMLMETCLQRSGTVPIIVRILFSRQSAQDLSIQLLHQIHRITSLSINVEDEELFQNNLRTLQQRAPVLRRLSIRSSPGVSLDGVILLNDEAPALRKLTLSGISLPPRLPNIFAKITALTLNKIDGSNFQNTFTHLLYTLRGCPGLQELSLSIKGVTQIGDTEALLIQVPLPKLHFLKVRLPRWACGLLLRCISVPLLEILVFSGSMDPPCTIDYFAASKAVPTGLVETMELELGSHVSFYSSFGEGSTKKAFVVRYCNLLPYGVQAIAEPAIRFWDMSHMTMLTLSLPPKFTVEGVPLFIQLMGACTRLKCLRINVLEPIGRENRDTYEEMLRILPITYVFVLLGVGTSSVNNENAEAVAGILEGNLTSLPGRHRNYPLPLLTNLELTGEPFVRCKKDIDTLVMFFQLRAYYGYKLQRLHVWGAKARLSDEHKQMLLPLVNVTQTDTL